MAWDRGFAWGGAVEQHQQPPARRPGEPWCQLAGDALDQGPGCRRRVVAEHRGEAVGHATERRPAPGPGLGELLGVPGRSSQGRVFRGQCLVPPWLRGLAVKAVRPRRGWRERGYSGQSWPSRRDPSAPGWRTGSFLPGRARRRRSAAGHGALADPTRRAGAGWRRRPATGGTRRRSPGRTSRPGSCARTGTAGRRAARGRRRTGPTHPR